MAMEKEDFLIKNVYYAPYNVLKKIWQTKIDNIDTLEVNYGEITDLTVLKDMAHLKNLKIPNTLIYDLSPIRNLTQLKTLNISGTKIVDLSPIRNLIFLEVLDIKDTKISDLSPLKDLIHLKHLNLSKTQIRDLQHLKDLIELQRLDMSKTEVKDLKPIENLSNLEHLDIATNQISDLSSLSKMINLKHLDISSTQVLSLTPLTNLLHLKSLNIGNTLIHDLYPLKKQLKLNLRIDFRIKRDTFLGVLYTTPVKQPQLINPPYEIFIQGNETILRYWKEQKRVGSRKITEARLLLLGQGGAGKTSLKEKIRDKNAPMPEPDETTRGINIERIICQNEVGESFTVQIWDFGGQSIQKYAHQFFMSDSVVYAVLTDERKQDRNFNYWFSIIELLGKDSPFFVVQNEREGHLEVLKDLTQIQERYPKTLKGVLPVNLKNAATDWRFDNLRNALLKTATELPHTQKEYLNSFFNIRQKLAALAQTQQTLPFKDFRQLCRDEGIEDVELMNDYARRFTELGIALHFEKNLHLRTQVFLNPKWIIDALFKLLYHPSVEQQKGLFSEANADTIWSEGQYDDMHGVLVQLMVQFQLCYETTKKGQYIVPQRLPLRKEPFTPPTDATHIVYAYKFLPSGLLTQLTCSLHHLIDGEKVWSDAVQFIDKNGKGRIFVRENEAEHKIEIFGFDVQKANLLNKVVDTLDTIHADSKFGNLRVEKQVPCPCEKCVKARNNQEESEFFNYDFLIELLHDGELESDRCKFSKKKFPIRTILKQSNIRVFSIEHIKNLLAKDQVENALNWLRGRYEEHNEVIVQLSRLARLNREKHIGTQTDGVFNAERSKIIQGVLAMLTEWEEE